MPTTTLKDSDRYSKDPYHNRPLFITKNINDQIISKVMINGNSVVNIFPIKTLVHWG